LYGSKGFDDLLNCNGHKGDIRFEKVDKRITR
jgi:hypothetical protein